MKKSFTNAEKVKHYTKKIARLQEYVERLKTLPPDEYQDFNTSRSDKEIQISNANKQLVDQILEALKASKA